MASHQTGDPTGVASDSPGHEKNGTSSQEDVAHAQPDILLEKIGNIHLKEIPVDDTEHLMDKIQLLTIEECRTIAANMLQDHANDYNFAQQKRGRLAALMQGPADGQTVADWELEFKTETAINRFFSPYPEVRAVATPVDDVDMPCETIRAFFLGLVWTAVGQFTNSLFSSRFPSISLTSSVTQILMYPCGILLAWILPDWGFTFGGQRVSLNPGPWTYKEQMLATIMINVGLGTAYCFYNIQTQAIYYKDQWLTPAYEILLLLSTQLMGLGFAGLLRRFVIYPVDAVWPTILPAVALNRALLVPEKKETIHGWSISRYKFFFICFGCMFVYFWFPDFIFQALSVFAWITWIAPTNFNLNLITGSSLGLGFNPIPSFDWSVTLGVLNPLSSPFFATVQQAAGMFIGAFAIMALYFQNIKWTGYLPINSSSIWDNTGKRYNTTRVIKDGALVVEKYKSYSPTFYSAGQLVAYGAFFAFYPCTALFIILDFWRPLSRSFKLMASAGVSTVKKTSIGTGRAAGAIFKGRFKEAGTHVYEMLSGDTSIYDGFDNPFTDMMRSYPEVPDWWFTSLAFISFIFSIIILSHWPQLDTPIWTIFFVIALNLAFLIPTTYLAAISGQNEGLNVLTELVVGYALPGQPEALMFVKAFGYNIGGQADNYISDQKMGFYAKIPPRAMFRGQITASILAVFICYGVVNFVDNSIPDICTPKQPSRFTCASGSNVFFSASMVWGAIGPERVFSQLYPALKYCFLLGFILAIVWWCVKNYGPHVREACRGALATPVFNFLNMVVFKPISWLKHVHPSLVLNGFLPWAPTNLSYLIGAIYISIIFQYYLRRYKTAWWEKYNYVLSAALGGGMAFSAIIIFFALQFHPVEIDWWGNNILGMTIDGGMDGARTVLLPDLPEKGTFGPDTWY
ncbi:Oligopeptide transporter 2 [Purpureocillium lavendulum]|uniref:Oligopeptide transporter 2 n=1 Tax=Purpureocillium lavendulum TaxID=1247861 RepID=A0AB34G9M8_9HYPO|nr:Oligopeptide transporter 2 [Purpureocillium lavendulum]